MATAKYTQEQVNAALAAELAARPNTPQADLTAYAKATYGLTDAQLNAAYDTIPGFNAKGQWDAADYVANSVPGRTDPQMVVDAANAANPYSAQNMAKVDTTRPGQYVTDPTTGRPVALSAYSPGFDINNPTALTYIGELISKGGQDSTSQAFNAIATPAQKAQAAQLWAAEKARLDAPAAQQGLLNTTGQTTQAGQATKTYTPAETALYNAYRSGDIAGANRAIQEGKLTAANMQSKFGLTNDEMSWMTNNAGVKFYTPTTAVTTGVTTGGTTVGGKTYTQAETDLYNAYKAGNIAEFNRIAAANKLTAGDMQSKFGLSQGEMNWITNNAGGKFYSPTDVTGTVTTGTVTNTGGLGGLGNVGAFGQNFANYQSIPIGAQYNPNVTVGGASPYSQIMGQMKPFSNPYANMPVNTPMGGYDPGLYDRIAAANVARAAAANAGTTLADYYQVGGDATATDGDDGGGDGGGNNSGTASGDCVDPDVHILLADRSTVRAGDLKVGDMLHTLHDETFVYGDFPVEYVNILQRPKVEAQFDDGQKIIISITHKFLTADNKWEKISDIEIGTSIRGFGDVTKKLVSITDVGTGPVIEMVVTDAHTYISEGLVSHNKFYGGLITNVSGPDPAGPDEGQVNMMRGEYVIKKSSVNKYGRGLLDMINEGKVPAKKLKSLLG